ncbi:MAG: hypothetical protein J4215_04435 [Candidatus Diapherotrites archaeon]|uniref:Uncharacterized protein n=1 Tax=Candidatus Iainarchaeum sp. TaxID=3101447 RepID=A0A8T4L4Q1_9ARCH|nr:hypothetical protein [Candidatus Diapherotrites archaeon]
MQEFWSIPAAHGNTTVKDWTIRILTQEWPLSLKQITERVQQQSGKTVSQQAVFKTLQDLVRQKVVEKHDKSYALNKEWITHLAKSVQDLQTTYENHAGQLPALGKLDTKTVIEFHDPSAVAVTVAQILASRVLTQGKPEPFYGIKRHGLWPLRFSFSDFELLKEMTKSIPCYCAVIGNDPFDRWVVEQYLKGGFKKSKTGAKAEFKEWDIMAHGEYVLTIQYAKETEQAIEYLFKQINNLSELFEKFSQEELSKFKFQATLTIERNPDLARLIKEKCMKILEE